MKTVGLLCGIRNSGKTNTLKAFFGVSHIKRLKNMQLLERNLNGKKVYAVGLTSPQELTNETFRYKEESGFCKFEEVIARIEKKFKKCDQKSQVEDYTFLISFTMFVEDEKINERCITKPIEWLNLEGDKVFSVYLRRDNDFLHLTDTLMKEIGASVIESKKDDYNRQAKELENIIKKHDC